MYIEDSVPLPPIIAGPVFLIPPPHTNKLRQENRRFGRYRTHLNRNLPLQRSG